MAGLVLLGTGIAGLFGKLPGVEPRPYIIRFTEDRPNPLYRRICYTLAWSEVIAFAVLNIAGLATAALTGAWRLRQMYDVAYFPIVITVWVLGALGVLPRVKPSTQGEGHERRYFYGSVWAVCIAQPILWALWKVLPHARWADGLKLTIFIGILVYVGNLARRGLLPRTRPIVPGELAVSDYRVESSERTEKSSFDRQVGGKRMSTTSMDDRGVILTCPSCGQRNRVPYGRRPSADIAAPTCPRRTSRSRSQPPRRSTRWSRTRSCRSSSTSGHPGAARVAWSRRSS